jgi:hypothetical protein
MPKSSAKTKEPTKVTCNRGCGTLPDGVTTQQHCLTCPILNRFHCLFCASAHQQINLIQRHAREEHGWTDLDGDCYIHDSRTVDEILADPKGVPNYRLRSPLQFKLPPSGLGIDSPRVNLGEPLSRTISNTAPVIVDKESKGSKKKSTRRLSSSSSSDDSGTEELRRENKALKKENALLSRQLEVLQTHMDETTQQLQYMRTLGQRYLLTESSAAPSFSSSVSRVDKESHGTEEDRVSLGLNEEFNSSLDNEQSDAGEKQDRRSTGSGRESLQFAARADVSPRKRSNDKKTAPSSASTPIAGKESQVRRDEHISFRSPLESVYQDRRGDRGHDQPREERRNEDRRLDHRQFDGGHDSQDRRDDRGRSRCRNQSWESRGRSQSRYYPQRDRSPRGRASPPRHLDRHVETALAAIDPEEIQRFLREKSLRK